MTDETALTWLDPPLPVSSTCPVCRRTGEGVCFLRVDERGHSVRTGGSVEVARCTCCLSVWFPDVDHGATYPPATESCLTPEFDLLIDHYVELVAGLDWKVATVERLPRRDNAAVLEVGCSVGVLLDYLVRSTDARVVGLEPSAYGLAGARRFGLPIHDMRMAEMIDREGREMFDLAIATEVIEHVKEPRSFLAEVRSLLRDGGIALLTTPNAAGLVPERTPGELFAMLSIGAHHFVLSARQMVALAKEVGFASVYVEETPTTLVAVLSDREVEIGAMKDPTAALYEYYADRVDDIGHAGGERAHLADMICHYVLGRELQVDLALLHESEIDGLLLDMFNVDVRDLDSLVRGLQACTSLYEFGRLVPFGLVPYLYFRGHRDDIDEQSRTEMWEAAVATAAVGIGVDPVNLFLLSRYVERTVAALDGRPSKRWHGFAAESVVNVPELAGVKLPLVRSRLNRRLRSRLTRLSGRFRG